ncbi:PREDICTED: ras-related protein Rab-17 [Tinamus guttatus]|nr:PREDICTED: ras-related protein Rab-17 [Tinamus guttatus]
MGNEAPSQEAAQPRLAWRTGLRFTDCRPCLNFGPETGLPAAQRKCHSPGSRRCRPGLLPSLPVGTSGGFGKPNTPCASLVGSFFTQTLCLEATTLKLEIWDTAGQEKYHSVCHLYYRGAHAALLVYDITSKETLSRAKLWLQELEKEFFHDEIVIALVGNKADLAAEREVTTEEGEEFARSRNLLYMETSAKSSYQVNELFTAVAQELVAREGKKAAVQYTALADLQEPRAPGPQCCGL